jgi:hypothetical protein
MSAHALSHNQSRRGDVNLPHSRHKPAAQSFAGCTGIPVDPFTYLTTMGYEELR